MSLSICTFVASISCFASDSSRRANEDSVLAIQIFDQKKFKKKDQGFLGVINVRVGDVINDMDIGGDGKYIVLVSSLESTDAA